MTKDWVVRMPAGPLVIFGGGNGIGYATAELAAEWCEDLTIVDLNKGAADTALVQTGKAKYRCCDAGDPAAVSALFDEIMERSGPLAGVVTTVGGAHYRDPLDFDLDAWRREIAFNLDTAYIVATLAAKRMAQHGQGAIVTLSSTIAATPRPERMGYSAAKSGVIAFTKTLATAVAAQGVRVNCVAPHSTDTPRFRELIGSEEAYHSRVEASPQKRISTPDDIAHAILFLMSEGARSITGQVLWVNNGNYMP